MRARLGAAIATTALALSVAGCGGESDRPSSSSSDVAGVDPSTLAGSCSLLVGPNETSVADAMAIGEQGKRAEDDDEAARVQNNLFKLVSAGAPEIQDPAGQLVDYLDDPKAYQTVDGVSAMITDAAKDIQTACAEQ